MERVERDRTSGGFETCYRFSGSLIDRASASQRDSVVVIEFNCKYVYVYPRDVYTAVID